MITDRRKARDRRAICRVIPERQPTCLLLFPFGEAGGLESWGGAHYGKRVSTGRRKLQAPFNIILINQPAGPGILQALAM